MQKYGQDISMLTRGGKTFSAARLGTEKPPCVLVSLAVKILQKKSVGCRLCKPTSGAIYSSLSRCEIQLRIQKVFPLASIFSIEKYQTSNKMNLVSLICRIYSRHSQAVVSFVQTPHQFQDQPGIAKQNQISKSVFFPKCTPCMPC